MLEMYTTQAELQEQWEALRGPKFLNLDAYRLARFAEARAIVAARKIIAEKDAEIMELKKEIVVMKGPRQ